MQPSIPLCFPFLLEKRKGHSIFESYLNEQLLSESPEAAIWASSQQPSLPGLAHALLALSTHFYLTEVGTVCLGPELSSQGCF